MGRPIIDLKDMIFGRLTVIKRVSVNKFGTAMWQCDCSCGNKNIIVAGNSLKSGNSKSCGCLRKKLLFKRNKKYNTYDLSGEYGIGYTLKEQPFYFDLEDYDKIKSYCWGYDEHQYIRTTITSQISKTRTTLSMHRLITNAKEDEAVDHIYHKTIDNRKSELRLVTSSQNGMNQIISSRNKSGVKGVLYDKKGDGWYASIRINRKSITKWFKNKQDAIDCRKTLEETYHGKYALKEKVDNK